MYKFLAIVNAAIVLSFAASAQVAPEVIFALFGIRLNGFGAVVARGYAAALIGYGVWSNPLKLEYIAGVRRSIDHGKEKTIRPNL